VAVSRSFLYALFSHHAHQTPSLGPFIAEPVPLQFQVLQGGVLFKAFGQGLTAALDQTLSPLSSPFLKISPAQGMKDEA